MASDRAPSELALRILAGMGGVATLELRAHLAAGHCVHGRAGERDVVLHAPGCTCVPCSNCNGSGFSTGDRPALCTICRGIGYTPGDELWESASDE